MDLDRAEKRTSKKTEVFAPHGRVLQQRPFAPFYASGKRLNSLCDNRIIDCWRVVGLPPVDFYTATVCFCCLRHHLSPY